MDDFAVLLSARRLLSNVGLDHLPVPMSIYLQAASTQLNGVPIVMKIDPSLGVAEAGHTMKIGGKQVIVVNGNDSEERQRFTTCHELAHILLGIPTEHGEDASHEGSGFMRRSPNETLCDVFAAELLLPYKILKERVADLDIAFETIDDLSGEFGASRTATGSRFASVCDRPCAFVIAQGGTIRYGARSTALRDIGGWIKPGVALPGSSLAGHLRRHSKQTGPIEIAADEWFDRWTRGGTLLEDSRYVPEWDQTVSLLWFEDDEPPPSERNADEDSPALPELTGILPWPGKSRRR